MMLTQVDAISGELGAVAKRAATAYERATSDVEAMFIVAEFLDEDGDYDGATHWYVAAGEAGDPDAMNEVGMRNFRIYTALAEDEDNEQSTLIEAWKAAMSWWHAAADGGSANAMLHLGMEYENNGEVDEARFWLKKAAANGQAGAKSHLNALK
jgi:TPR repeat protein